MLKQIGANTYVLRGGSNIGFIVCDGSAVVIDAGLDKDAARRAAKAAAELDARIKAIIITHAHADHFGGAEALKKRTGAPVYASSFEAVVIENPVLEPLWLFGGALPIRSLTNKFTLGKPCRVDVRIEGDELSVEGIKLKVVRLPGHSPEQIGIGFEDTLFCADAFFPIETLEKHGIPYCTDLDAALATLDAFVEGCFPYAHFIPGHGEPLEDPVPVAQANKGRLEQIRDVVYGILAIPSREHAILANTALLLNMRFRDVVHYYLCRTTVYAVLASLEKQGLVEVITDEDGVKWRRRIQGPSLHQ